MEGVGERQAARRARALIPGVITHSSNIVEHPELIAERIGRFAKAVGRENVIAGADCGFASFAATCEVHPSRRLGQARRLGRRRPDREQGVVGLIRVHGTRFRSRE